MVRIKRTWLIVTLLAVSAISQRPAVALQTKPAPITIPFDVTMRHLIVKVAVNSRPLSFVLDTGASVAIIRMLAP